MHSGTTIIIGGVAGGASCAARLRRLDEQAHIIILERGPHVSFANCGLPYFIGDVIADQADLLVTKPETLRQRYRLDVRTMHEVQALNTEQRTVTVFDRESDQHYQLDYDQLVLAPGARPFRPDLPGIDQPGIFTIRTVPDSVQVRQWIAQKDVKRAIVIGGGFIGLEMVENLVHRGIAVTLIERNAQVMTALDAEMVAPLHNRLREHGVGLLYDHQVTGFSSSELGLNVETDHGSYQTDMVILAIGVRPESDLAVEAGITCNQRGAIVVNASMRTSDPHVYAVGDAVEVEHAILDQRVQLPLAGPANRQGRLAADNIAGHTSAFRGVQGTAVIGVLGLTVACTGLTEKAARAYGQQAYQKIRIHAGHHVGYYPGAREISLKLLFDPDNGRVLGAQAIGEHGVDKRIDVIAMAIQMGATVDDLAQSELCYAPAFGAAKDVVNLAGMLAANVQQRAVTVAHWEDIADHDYIIDVRPREDFEQAHPVGAINIPLAELRNRLDELPAQGTVFVTCRVGQTAYNATRLLMQLGYDARFITGGLLSQRAVHQAGLCVRSVAD